MVINPTVLLVADDVEAGQAWAAVLAQKGITVYQAATAPQAIEWRIDNNCELIIVDVTTPSFDYLDLIRELRVEATIPILLLLPGPDETRAVAAYDAGVDECVEKPIGPRLFLAKTKAWLQRAWAVPAELLDGIQVGSLRIDPGQRQFYASDGRSVQLTNLEFRVMYLLMRNADQVLLSDLIIDRVWGSAGGDSALLKNVIYRLRRKIEPDPGQPRFILAVARQGYVFHGQ